MLKKILAFVLMLYAAVAFAAVDANKGTAAELDGVKGIGPAISSKIVEERKKAPFKDWDDLIARVKGIGDKSAAKLSEAGLTVNGAEFKGAAAAPKETKAATKAEKAAPKAEEKKAAASGPAVKEEKKDAKAEAKAKKEEEKKAKAEEKAKKAEEAKAKKEAAKAKKAEAAKPAASAASAKK